MAIKTSEELKSYLAQIQQTKTLTELNNLAAEIKHTPINEEYVNTIDAAIKEHYGLICKSSNWSIQLPRFNAEESKTLKGIKIFTDLRS